MMNKSKSKEKSDDADQQTGRPQFRKSARSVLRKSASLPMPAEVDPYSRNTRRGPLKKVCLVTNWAVNPRFLPSCLAYGIVILDACLCILLLR